MNMFSELVIRNLYVMIVSQVYKKNCKFQTPVLESLFNKVAGLQGSNTSVFL